MLAETKPPACAASPNSDPNSEILLLTIFAASEDAEMLLQYLQHLTTQKCRYLQYLQALATHKRCYLQYMQPLQCCNLQYSQPRTKNQGRATPLQGNMAEPHLRKRKPFRPLAACPRPTSCFVNEQVLQCIPGGYCEGEGARAVCSSCQVEP